MIILHFALGRRNRPLTQPENLTTPRQGLSVGLRLATVVLAVVVPMLLLVAAIIMRLAGDQRNAEREAVTYVSRAILGAVDAQLSSYAALAQTLASSPALQQKNLVAFREEAERSTLGLPGSWVALADERGQQILNTLAPTAAPLPSVAPQILADEIRAFETKKVWISDVVVGPVAKFPVVTVGAPVFRVGQPAYYVMIGIDTAIFHGLLNSQRLPEGWLAAVMDRSGNFVARSLDHERWVGQPGPPSWRAIGTKEGWFKLVSLEGNPVTTANFILPLNGWAVAASAREEVFEAPIRQTVIAASLGGLLVTLFSVLLAVWAARSITRPIRALVTAAWTLRLRRNDPVSFAPTGVPEVNRALEAFAAASAALLEHEARLRVAITEAERANAAKSNFLAAASHDLRQPFQALRLFLDLLNQQLTDPTHLKVARNASAALAAGENLLHALLDISKLDAGTVAVQRQQFPFSQIAADLKSQYHDLARQKGLVLRVVNASMIIDSDPVLLARVLRNLLDNALKYTSRGKILLGCRRTGDGGRIEVWDTGIGIAPNQQHRIFDDFYQIDNDGRDRSQGLGIGLAVVRRTAVLLGHEITVRSWEGRGTVFTVHLGHGRAGIANSPPMNDVAQDRSD